MRSALLKTGAGYADIPGMAPGPQESARSRRAHHSRRAPSRASAAIVLALVAALATAAPAAGHPRRELLANATTGFGVTEDNFEVGTCSPEDQPPLTTELEQCTYGALETQLQNHQTTVSYTQADGHPQYGVVTFGLNTEESERGTENTEDTEATEPRQFPIGQARNVRVDLPQGLSINPRAVPQCPLATFEAEQCASQYPQSEVGAIELHFVNEGDFKPGEYRIPIYNLVPRAGLPLETGFSSFFTGASFIEGGLSWHTEAGQPGLVSGDFHPYFELHNLPDGLALLSVRQSFNGNAVGSGFVRMPSACSGPIEAHIELESYGYGDGPSEDSELPPGTAAETSQASTHIPGVVEGCDKPPFAPNVVVSPSNRTSDKVDAASVEITMPQNQNATELGSSDLKAAAIELPRGMTLNPAAAAGLEGCTPEEAGIEADGTRTAIAEVACPAGSKLGTVQLEAPMLPVGALSGGIYLGTPTATQLQDHEYTIYVTAENVKQYGVAVRLRGTITTNGEERVVATFLENPQLPFTSLRLSFRGGPSAVLSNPLSCGTAASTGELLPFSGASALLAETAFEVDNCTLPQFGSPALTATATVSPQTAGSASALTFSVVRPVGERYVQQLKATLPAGISAKLASVPLCDEAAANAGTCPQASAIGSVRILAGSGEPFAFTGAVYLTEGYDGAPFGLSIVVPTRAGPFYFGEAVSRAKVEINPTTAQITVVIVATTVQGQTSAGLPTSVGGIPLRIRELSVTIDRPGFIINPTDCSALTDETSLGSVAPEAQATLTSPFTVANCSSLAFDPSLTASSTASTPRSDGAALKIKITQPAAQANIASVSTTLPAQLPSRASTLTHACSQATFQANPNACPAASHVGTGTAVTPTLSGTLSGPAYIVSRGRSFPDLEVVLNGSGVRLILDGHTAIKAGITTATFGSNPDVPISSFTLDLPAGPNSLLSANGSLCEGSVDLSSSIRAQSGKVVSHIAKIAVTGCPQVTAHRTTSRHATITVKTPAAGIVKVSGRYLRATTVRFAGAISRKLRIRLTKAGRALVRRLHAEHRTLRVRVSVSFTARARGSAAVPIYVTLAFR